MKTGGAIVTGACLFSSLVAYAETPLPPQRPRDPPIQAAPDPLPPYEAKLDRLAELLGTLSFMRDLCGVGDGSVWRSQMAALLQSEGSLPERRDRLAGAFNRGFRGYATSYRSCTPAADLVIERSLAEGSALSRELSARFGS